jgi:hypothetical protein
MHVRDEKYAILFGKSEGKRSLGRPRCRWKDIRMDLREVGWEGCGLDVSGSG